MPVSHQYKALFIHIPKTGGGSIEQALGIYGINNKGSNIHCTKIFYGYREITPDRLEEFNDNCPKEKVFHCCNRGIKRYLKKYFFYPVYEEHKALQHWTLLEIRKKISVWNYFKFSFVRNPYERLVSEYLWRIKKKEIDNMNFSDFINKIVIKNVETDRHLLHQYKFITNAKGKIKIDFLGRFEHFQDDFNKLKQKLGIHSELPKIHKSNDYNYKDYYDKKSLQVVSSLYKADLEIFNYSF